MTRATRLLALALLGLAGAQAAAAAETRLVLVGGGTRPARAMARFVEWAGGPQSRILIVPWASAEPKESCEAIIEELRGGGPSICAASVSLDQQGKAAPLPEEVRATFVQALARATGVFFTGGDQNRVMDVLDAPLRAELKARYTAGVVFGGTSAGTALISDPMITGEGDLTVIDGDKVGVRPGLGLLPGVILDQHFIERQLQNRLFGLVLKQPGARGIGIDENAALLVTNGRLAEVVGGPVVLVDAAGPDQLAVRILRAGQSVDLRTRPRRERPSQPPGRRTAGPPLMTGARSNARARHARCRLGDVGARLSARSGTVTRS